MIMTDKKLQLQEQREWLERYILNPKQSQNMIALKMEKLREQERLKRMLDQIRKNQK